MGVIEIWPNINGYKMFSHKCGLTFNLAFHYSRYHEYKISKCACGDKT